MKYDDYEKVQCNNYPNDNIIVQTGKRHRKSWVNDKKKLFDTVYAGVIFMTAFATIMLLSSIITLATTGSLAAVFTSIFS